MTLDLVDRKVDGRCGSADTGAPVQAVVITDPVLATQILRSKAVDKLRFMYSFLDVVRSAIYPPSQTAFVMTVRTCSHGAI